MVTCIALVLSRPAMMPSSRLFKLFAEKEPVNTLKRCFLAARTMAAGTSLDGCRPKASMKLGCRVASSHTKCSGCPKRAAAAARSWSSWAACCGAAGSRKATTQRPSGPLQSRSNAC